jgi:hypothetical protein
VQKEGSRLGLCWVCVGCCDASRREEEEEESVAVSQVEAKRER